MSADSPASPAETLNVTLKFADVATFVARFANLVEHRRILLPGVAARAQGTVLRFHLKLKDGTALIGGVGRVESIVAAGSIPGCPPGMVLQYQPDDESRALVERVLQGRPDAPSPNLPPTVELPPLPATAADAPAIEEAVREAASDASSAVARAPSSEPAAPSPPSAAEPAAAERSSASGEAAATVDVPSAPAPPPPAATSPAVDAAPGASDETTAASAAAVEAPAPAPAAPRPGLLGRAPLAGRLASSGGLSPDLKPGAPRLPPLAIGAGLRPRPGLPPVVGRMPLGGVLGKPPLASGGDAGPAAPPDGEAPHDLPPPAASLAAEAAAWTAASEELGAPAEQAAGPTDAGQATPDRPTAATTEATSGASKRTPTGTVRVGLPRPSTGAARGPLPGRISPTPLFGALAVPRATAGERSTATRIEAGGEVPGEEGAAGRAGLPAPRPALGGLSARKPGEPRPGGFPGGLDSRGRTRPGLGSITGAAIPAVPRAGATPAAAEPPPVEPPPASEPEPTAAAPSEPALLASAPSAEGAAGQSTTAVLEVAAPPPLAPPQEVGPAVAPAAVAPAGDAATLLGSVPPAAVAAPAAAAVEPVLEPDGILDELPPLATIAGLAPVPPPVEAPAPRLAPPDRDDAFRFRTPAGVAPIPMPPSKSPQPPGGEAGLFDDDSPFRESSRSSPPSPTAAAGDGATDLADEGLPPLSSLPTQITPSRPPVAAGPPPSSTASTLVMPASAVAGAATSAGPSRPSRPSQSTGPAAALDEPVDDTGPPPARLAIITLGVLAGAALLGILLGTLLP